MRRGHPLLRPAFALAVMLVVPGCMEAPPPGGDWDDGYVGQGGQPPPMPGHLVWAVSEHEPGVRLTLALEDVQEAWVLHALVINEGKGDVELWSAGCGFLSSEVTAPDGRTQLVPQQYCLGAVKVQTLAAGTWLYESFPWNGTFHRYGPDGEWHELARDGVYQWEVEVIFDGWYEGNQGARLATQVDFPLDRGRDQ